jgi:hypothetical protein
MFTHWDALQTQQVLEEEDEFGISPGISRDDFERAEHHVYELPPKPLDINFDNPNFLQSPAIPTEDVAYITKFYDELGKVKMETCKTCNRRWFDLKVYRSECDFCRANAPTTVMNQDMCLCMGGLTTWILV